MPYKNKEKGRESDRRYYERHREKRLAWQREYNRRYYEQNRERILEQRRLRRKTDSQYHEKQKKSQRLSYRKTAEAWGVQKSFRKPQENLQIAMSSELFVSQVVLPKHGFTSIIVCRMFNKQFPFDILAKKDGKRVAIEVTTSLHKTVEPKKKLLLDFMGADLYICHLKPDFSRYYLFPLNLEKKTTSNCDGIFMESVRAQGVRFKEAS